MGSLKTGTTSLWSHLVDNTDGRPVCRLTDKGDISRKEKDFFGARHVSSRIELLSAHMAGVHQRAGRCFQGDGTRRLHITFGTTPKNMAAFLTDSTPRPRLAGCPTPSPNIGRTFGSSPYGATDKVSFSEWTAPKLARTKECLRASNGQSPLWPPAMPPPYRGCAPHLDHGLYEPQMRRWLEFFKPAQMLLVSFAGWTRRPSVVVRDVLLHAGMTPAVARTTAERVREAKRTKNQNSRATGHGRLSARWRSDLHALYDPFTERLYGLIQQHAMAVTPCDEQGTRFLDDPAFRAAKGNATLGAGTGSPVLFRPARRRTGRAATGADDARR